MKNQQAFCQQLQTLKREKRHYDKLQTTFNRLLINIINKSWNNSINKFNIKRKLEM